MRLTIDEYSQRYKMSKEMISSKIRAKQLNYIIDNGTTYIITAQKETQEPSKAVSKPKTTVAMILGLYQRENQQLKEKIVQLEAKIDRLINDKEQMLRDEMHKIEKLYSDKDMQLKQILELVNAKFIADKRETIHEVETVEESKKVSQAPQLVELKAYLKTLDLEPYQRKIIRKRFLAVYNEDIRVIKQNGQIFLNFAKYDYSDLLEY
ncbi:MAG: hypothetical protein JXQ67_01480 [Campylobacterales bacterium]|nr:hypothetical protein [Campylobacterales bacterium]